MKYITEFGKNVILKGQSNHIKFSILPTEKDYMVEENKKPVFLIAVIDKSGSMGLSIKNEHSLSSSINKLHSNTFDRETKLDCAKNATCNLIDCLQESDMFAAIAFDNRISLVQEPIITKEQNIPFIKNNIQSIYTGGCTNISDALILARELITKEYSQNYNCKIILLSDGCANIGFQTTKEFINLTQTLTDKNISVSTIGLGIEYNLEIMEAIAGNSGGIFYHVDNANIIADLFIKELKTTRNIILKNAKITFKVSDGYTFSENLNKFPQKTISDKQEIEIGNIYSDKHIYLEIQAKENVQENAKIEIEVYDNNKCIFNGKELLTLAETNNEVKENSNIVKEILELIKNNYIINSGYAYSTKNTQALNNYYLNTSSSLENVLNTYSLNSNCSLKTEIENLYSQYSNNAISEETNRMLFSTSSYVVRNTKID